jgi:hypothetical protein
MLEPSRRRPPVQIVRQVDAPAAPTAALVLDSLGRMHPATAITLVLTVAGMVVGGVIAIVALVATVLATVAAIAGMVAVAGIGATVAAIVLGSRQGTSSR